MILMIAHINFDQQSECAPNYIYNGRLPYKNTQAIPGNRYLYSTVK